jgi:hypothetical protein
MLHAINVVEWILTLVVKCPLLISYAMFRCCERFLELVLFYIVYEGAAVLLTNFNAPNDGWVGQNML